MTVFGEASAARRVIGAEHISDAHERGRIALEIFPGDIVTAQAAETAERLGVSLLEGPLDRPAPPRTDGATTLRRVLYRRAPGWISPRPSKTRGQRRLAKLALIGAGGVGANIGHLAAMSDTAEEIALIDIVPGLAAATALDLNHAGGILRTGVQAIGGDEPGLVAGADVVVVTAGRPRTPGMKRADLIAVNRRVVQRSAEAIKSAAPNAVVMVVTNPLDEMTVEMLRATGFARNQVIGMAGTLDSARFRKSLAEAAGVGTADVDAMTLGAHGDEMVPIVSCARIKGRPLDVFLDKEAIDACVRDAVSGGGQVVALRKTGSATMAPAHAVMELIDHIRGARSGPVPATVMLEGEYGVSGTVLGVPCHLGAKGLIEVAEITLADNERAALSAAADAVRARLLEAAS